MNKKNKEKLGDYHCPMCGYEITIPLRKSKAGWRLCKFCDEVFDPEEQIHDENVLLVLDDLRDMSKHYHRNFLKVRGDFEDMLDKAEHGYLIEVKNGYQQDMKDILELYLMDQDEYMKDILELDLKRR